MSPEGTEGTTTREQKGGKIRRRITSIGSLTNRRDPRNNSLPLETMLGESRRAYQLPSIPMFPSSFSRLLAHPRAGDFSILVTPVAPASEVRNGDRGKEKKKGGPGVSEENVIGRKCGGGRGAGGEGVEGEYPSCLSLRAVKAGSCSRI